MKNSCKNCEFFVKNQDWCDYLFRETKCDSICTSWYPDESKINLDKRNKNIIINRIVRYIDVLSNYGYDFDEIDEKEFERAIDFAINLMTLIVEALNEDNTKGEKR